MTVRLRLRVLAVTAAVPLLAACGIQTTSDTQAPSSSATTNGQQAADAKIAALVPAKLKSAGKIVVATDPTYAPMIFRDPSGKIVGLDASLAEAAAAKMGLGVSWVNVPFDGIIAGLAADKFDASWASFSVTPERMKTVSFVSYLRTGTQVLLKADSSADLSSTQGLCGLTVTAQRGTSQDLQIIPELNKQCTAAGKPAIKPLILPQQDNVNQAVAVGRADAELADSAIVAYQAAQKSDTFKTVNLVIEPTLVGVAVPKDDDQLVQAIQAATQALIEDGTYARILAQWKLEAGAVATADVHKGGI